MASKELEQARAALPALREELGKLNNVEDLSLTWVKTASDQQCLKFLVGHKSNVKEVTKLMTASSKWRFEKGIRDIVERVSQDQSVLGRFARAYFPICLLGKDSEGRAVCYNRMGAIDFTRIINADEFGMDRFIEFSVFGIEEALKDNVPKENCVIIDLDSQNHPNPPITRLLEVSPWISSLLKYVQALAGALDLNYPETIHKIVFVNAPTMFWASWKIARTFLAERTRDKVEVFSSLDSSKKRLSELFAASILPVSLGGSNPLNGVGIGGKLAKGSCLQAEFVAKLEEAVGICGGVDKEEQWFDAKDVE